VADPCWVCLPLNLRNAVSQFEPQWCCWEPGREADWVRQPPAGAVTDEGRFPFFRARMEFEEFCPEWALWRAGGKLAAQLVGIRTQESLNRWRTIASRSKNTHCGLQWTTWTGGPTYNAYPVYDWRTEDVWGYYAREKVPYNPLYDRMHQAGLTIHQARICQPYGDDQRKGLWLYQLIEPETWARVVARVNGANMGAIYAREAGNVLGRISVAKPDGITWRQFAEILLASMPPPAAEHYRNKITMFHKYYWDRGYAELPDEGPASEKGKPSWTRICKTILRNDYHCKSLSFSPTKTGGYEKYMKLMEKRRREWGFMSPG
jgi:predicted phosphoadenosine phosphosulfate sulfurtransferase